MHGNQARKIEHDGKEASAATLNLIERIQVIDGWKRFQKDLNGSYVSLPQC